MKFKILRSNFFKTLSHLQGIVDKKNSLPILSNILIEAKENQITLSSTDMDISIIEKISCDILEDGSVYNVEIIKYPDTKFLNNFIDDIYSLEFFPAKIDEKPVIVRYQLPISFVKS